MFAQMVINGIIASAFYVLVGLGFAVTYSFIRFFNLSHGIIITIGAYVAFLFSSWMGIPIGIALCLGLTSGIILGCMLELLIFRPLRYKKSPALVLLLASLGIYLVLQNLISVVFGDDAKRLSPSTIKEGFNLFDARITFVQIITICLSVALLIALSIFFKKTNIGKAMRAVANDPELANISGIASDKVILWAFGIGSTLAGLAGILMAFDVDMTPTMGMHALMMGVVVVIIGGVNSILGIALGALLLGMAQNFGAWYIGSQWQDAIAFVILVLFLLFKPEGFFGKKVKSATV